MHFFLWFSNFWVTLPCATHLIICVSPNGGKLKQNCVLVLPVNNVLMCRLSIMVLPEFGQFSFLKKKLNEFCRSFQVMSSFILFTVTEKVRCVLIRFLLCSTSSYPPYLSYVNFVYIVTVTVYWNTALKKIIIYCAFHSD